MKRNRLVIERPELQSPLQRATSSGITFIFWVIWLYLWLPLISLIAWWVGIKFFREHMIENGGYIALFNIVGWYALIIFIIGITLIGWGRYNLIRFRSKGRRKGSVPIDLATHARDFKVDPQQLLQWQAEKHIVIHHDKHGVITQVETTRLANKASTV